MNVLYARRTSITGYMPAFRLNQEIEMKVYDVGFAEAAAVGYLRSRTKENEARPLAATAFVSGFMGGAFLGQLPNWIENAFETEVYTWIMEGHSASRSLEGQYVGMSYEANLGDECSRGGLALELAMTGAVVIDLEKDIHIVGMVIDPMQNELWRPVIFYPGAFVSAQGRVRDWKDIRNPRISSSHVYPHAEIPYGGSKMVHEIVAETWLGPRPKGMYVCHGNDNKQDARLTNLRYDTSAANVLDKIRNRSR